MHKNKIHKLLIIALMSFLIAGCDKKSTEVVLTEPLESVGEDRAVASDNAGNIPDEDKGALYDEKSSKEKASDQKNETDADGGSNSKENEPQIPDTVMVYVCGAVMCEGVYELPTGSRVVDAIKAAGGFLQDADTEFVNQALVLEDGIKIKIPTIEESLQAGDPNPDKSGIEGSDSAGITGLGGGALDGAGDKGSKVNINTASEAELCTIPGIGPGRARNIIAYREENGKFGTIDDIMKVSGIKDKFFAKIKDHITV